MNDVTPNDLKAEAKTMASLITDIIGDGQKLVRQEIALAREELKEEVAKLKSIVPLTAAGALLPGIGLFSLALSLAAGLQALGVAAWAAHLLSALAFVGTGLICLQLVKSRITNINLVPRKTVESIKENTQWLKNQT